MYHVIVYSKAEPFLLCWTLITLNIGMVRVVGNRYNLHAPVSNTDWIATIDKHYFARMVLVGGGSMDQQENNMYLLMFI